MAIITKPAGGILKGVPASISLSKSELSALPLIIADSYFSNANNWNKVILKYRSSSGKQYEVVQFDATLSSPTGNFLVSIKARDAFEIQAIEIHDFDNDIFIVPRSALNVADFDVVLSSAPSSLSYSTPVTYTQNTAITNNVPTVTGTVTSYSILPALPAGLSLNTTTGIISGTPTEVSAATNYVVTASNGAGSTTATISITVEAEIIDEFWDVANKSGVGTVSVGANRLITKTSGGAAYDVNVLSLQTITGDGYIEFPNSSLLNIGNYGVPVIGLAEQTSTNGGFQNILLGAFTVNNNWERVVNGSTAGFISAPSPNDIVRIGRIGTEYYIKINDVIKTQVTINNTNPLKASISLFTTGTGVDNITVESAEVLVGDPIIWDTFLNGSTPEADGGISGGTSGAIVKSNASKAGNGVDFKFTFNFTRGPANDSWDYLWGIMPSTANTGFIGWTGVTLQSANSILIYDNYSGSGAHTASFTNGMIVDGPNTSEFEKIGNVLTIKMNGVTIYTKNNYTEQTSVPMVRLWQGEQVLDSAYAEIQQVVVGDPILWQSKPGYIIEADGGATATSERPSYGEYYRVFAPSSQWVTGDFTFEAEINNAWQGNDYIGFYDSDTNFTMTTGFNGSQVRYEQSTPANYVKPAGDTYTLKMQRTGYVLKFYVNDVEVYSVTQANLSTVKVPFFTFTDSTKHIVSATLLLPTATNYINWDLLTGYQAGSLTITPTSGVSGGISLSGNDVAVKSDADKATGDFDYTFKFDWSAATSVVDMFAGVTGNNVTSGTSFYPNLTCIYGNGNNPDTAYLWHNGSSVGGTTQTLLGGVNTYRLKRVGTTITHYLNDVQIYSATSTSFTAYPSVRTMGNSVVTESYITEAPAFTGIYIDWTERANYVTQVDGGLTSDLTNPADGSESNLIFSNQIMPNNENKILTFKMPSSTMWQNGQHFFGVVKNGSYSGFWKYGTGNSADFAFLLSNNTGGGLVGQGFPNMFQNDSSELVLQLKLTPSATEFYVNNILVRSLSPLGTSVSPAVRTYQGMELTEAYITPPPIAQAVTWNVAGKTGIGTVTTGANGLITKATGGDGYNVNVLSNETITGDGYVEFIWGHGNIVMGMAETNEPSGSYTNIVYGGYVSGNGTAGLWEQTSIGSFNGSAMLNNSIVVGDVIRIERVGNLYKAFKNGLLMHSCNINNTNPMKASISIYHNGIGIGGATISE